MTPAHGLLADKLGELRRRIADFEEKADRLRQKLIATGQSTIAGERFVASIRRSAMHELDMDRLRKRLSEAQLQCCLVATEHIIVTTHERGDDE